MESHALKITWKVELWQSLELDRNYSIAIQWSIVNLSTSPNHDGSLSYTYSLKPVNVLVHSDMGDTIKAKDPRSESTKFRSLMKYKFDSWESGSNFKEFEDFYASVYKSIYKNLDFILNN